ncbi:MAG: hypothetical protein M0P64_00565 [Candidatus Pacebacteria bacterium]|jgi:hypothetical protein|nr:hypothetical protein [Candidatus Paceibacterota bacterium]
MAEYDYHPDFCGLCLQDIAPNAPIAIIDEVESHPKYYHLGCLFEAPELVASIHGYPKIDYGGQND